MCKNTIDTVKLLDSLGFVVHPDRSAFLSTRKLVFLGFILDSVPMLVFLTKEKALNLKHAAVDLLHCKSPTIGDVARVLGLIVSSFQGVALWPTSFSLPRTGGLVG